MDRCDFPDIVVTHTPDGEEGVDELCNRVEEAVQLYEEMTERDIVAARKDFRHYISFRLYGYLAPRLPKWGKRGSKAPPKEGYARAEANHVDEVDVDALREATRKWCEFHVTSLRKGVELFGEEQEVTLRMGGYIHYVGNRIWHEERDGYFAQLQPEAERVVDFLRQHSGGSVYFSASTLAQTLNCDEERVRWVLKVLRDAGSFNDSNGFWTTESYDVEIDDNGDMRFGENEFTDDTLNTFMQKR